MRDEHGGWDVGHESGSGDSWGAFQTFRDPLAAVTAAYRWARDRYDCPVQIPQAVFDALPESPGPPPAWEDF